MKNFIKLLTLAAVMFACDTQAQLLTSFGGTGTKIGTTNSYFVVSAMGVGFPKIEYIDAVSDKEASKVLFYKASNPVTFTGVNTSGNTTLTNVVGTSFAAGNVAVIQYKTNNTDTYQRIVVDSATATSIVSQVACSAAISPGDQIYKMTTNGFYYTGIVSNKVTVPMHWGQTGRPILVEIDGTSSCQINLIGGRYER